MKLLKITTGVAAALLASACERQSDEWTTSRDTAICTDRSGRRVADTNCGQRAYAGGHGGGSNAFPWYYLGRNSAIPPYGEPATGGSYTARAASYSRAPAATGMTRSAAISRGGFGSSAHSFGGFGE